MYGNICTSGLDEMTRRTIFFL